MPYTCIKCRGEEGSATEVSSLVRKKNTNKIISWPCNSYVYKVRRAWTGLARLKGMTPSPTSGPDSSVAFLVRPSLGTFPLKTVNRLPPHTALSAFLSSQHLSLWPQPSFYFYLSPCTRVSAPQGQGFLSVSLNLDSKTVPSTWQDLRNIQKAFPDSIQGPRQTALPLCPSFFPAFINKLKSSLLSKCLLICLSRPSMEWKLHDKREFACSVHCCVPSTKAELALFIYSLSFSWMNDRHHHDHGSGSPSTQCIPDGFTCILSPEPHKDPMSCCYYYSHFIGEETQTDKQKLAQGHKPSKRKSQQLIASHLTWVLLLITVE